jgi:hypothetical protein
MTFICRPNKILENPNDISANLGGEPFPEVQRIMRIHAECELLL